MIRGTSLNTYLYDIVDSGETRTFYVTSPEGMADRGARLVTMTPDQARAALWVLTDGLGRCRTQLCAYWDDVHTNTSPLRRSP